MKKQKRFLAIISIKIAYTVVYKQGSDKDLLFNLRLEYLYPVIHLQKRKKAHSQENLANKYFFIVYLFTST